MISKDNSKHVSHYLISCNDMALMLFAGAIRFQWPLKISHAQQVKMPELLRAWFTGLQAFALHF